MNSSKKMINYFKKWDGMGTLGVGLLAVGFFILWIDLYRFSYTASIVLILLGLAAFLYGNVGRANATQIDDTIKRQWESIRFPELEENSSLRKRTPKDAEALCFEGYEMRNGLYFKKKKDASIISSEYTCAKAVFLKDALYIKTCTFSLITEEKNMKTVEIPFSSLQSIDVIRNTLLVGHGDKPQFRVKTCHIAISYGDGEQILLPKKEDAYIEEYAQELKKKCVIIE